MAHFVGNFLLIKTTAINSEFCLVNNHLLDAFKSAESIYSTAPMHMALDERLANDE